MSSVTLPGWLFWLLIFGWCLKSLMLMGLRIENIRLARRLDACVKADVARAQIASLITGWKAKP